MTKVVGVDLEAAEVDRKTIDVDLIFTVEDEDRHAWQDRQARSVFVTIFRMAGGLDFDLLYQGDFVNYISEIENHVVKMLVHPIWLFYGVGLFKGMP